MDNEAGPSRPKKPKYEESSCQSSDCEMKDFSIKHKDEDTDEQFNFDDEESSDNDDISQPLSFQPPITFHDVKCEIQSPLSPMELQASDEPLTSGISSWASTGGMEDFKFTQNNVFYGPQNGDPIDFFNYFFDKDFLQFICDQTNEQAVKLLLSEKTKKESRITRWKDLTVDELKMFIGLLFHMGTIQLSRFQDYWKKDRLFAIPIFSQRMSRNRFLIIMRCLHFTTETCSEDPLYKIQALVNYFNEKMADCYYPARELILDEIMVLEKGRLVLRQRIKNEHKNGLKLYMLTEPDGLILRFRVHAGSKDFENTEHNKNIVLKLLEDFLYNGHEVYIDNYFNSVTLAKDLLDKRMYCTGILRSNLKSNPNDIIQKKLKRGENISRFYEGVHVGKWKDKRDTTYITTQYPDRLVPVANTRGQVKYKPEAIAKYNYFMSCVDRQDQLLSFYPCERITVRWCLKIAIHTFHLLFMNSYKIYNKYSGKPKMRLYDFRLSVIDMLLSDTSSDVLQTESPNDRISIKTEKTATGRMKGKDRRQSNKRKKRTNISSDVPQAPRMGIPSHTITRITEKSSKGRIKRKHCRQCYKNKKRTDTTWQCAACDDKPGLCVECFDVYHAEL